ncbi:M1 family metallopeptidase [Micromonospora cathayae]|uniref:Aminopeptidase N n=1 Tax=Micromonospora cathayae TaxID=3028804 RepID=A0ABY7ZS12_9ACTN|nr:M1 family metallopeptidase [Micromonospora sp. HUAS 3]WDZ85263.1 M1 family metallopeptidase [Micromonospora sp. HUAS 3]
MSRAGQAGEPTGRRASTHPGAAAGTARSRTVVGAVRARAALGVVLTLATVGALAGCTDRADPDGSRTDGRSDSRTDSRGTAGVGDPYFPTYGNGGYDVAGYALRVRYDPATDRLDGTATITATSTGPLTRFNLDLVGLTVTTVTVDGRAAGHRRDGAELVVTPADRIAADRRFTVEVRYAGVPATVTSPELGNGGFLHTSDGAVAVGQPQSASTWFPVNDHPSDKATYVIEVTVPDGLAALSNGEPTGRTSADGWTTWKWAERTPMASYLSTLVIGEYRVSTGEHKGRPVVTAVAAGLPADGPAARSIARTTEIADYLESVFGPYPVTAYGGIAIDDPRVGYALETQSRPVYGPGFFRDGRPNLDVVVHELAHQWFGNSVSIRRWPDIWLNEGLASYAEWLWAEHTGGQTVHRSFELQYAVTDWSKPTLDPGRAELFSTAVYQRGALAVHALRRTVGDDTFFRILRTWTAERRDGTVVTADLVALAERVSGRSLRPLFDAWLVGTTAPDVP